MSSTVPELQDLMVDLDLVDLHALLAGWEPVLGGAGLPMLVTALGDAFVQHPHDGSVGFLDVAARRLEPLCDSAEQLHELLEDPEFVEHYFDPAAVQALRDGGLELAAGQVYALAVPASAGGEWRRDNVVALPVAEHFARLAPASP